ncbi:MAG: hypothetical protein ABI855_04675, partial [Bacteroidota bacterium]
MKILIVVIPFALFINLSKAQRTYDDIFKTKTVYFYGYDFTNFRFVEEKRTGREDEIKSFIFDLTDLMNKKRKKNFYEKLIKKDTVIFDQQTVMNLNKEINIENIMSFTQNSIPKDSLQNIINKYDTKGKSGVGFVQIIECFYKPEKQASIWYVFFDISTKKILDTYENINNDVGKYHTLRIYWGASLWYGMAKYHNYYS